MSDSIRVILAAILIAAVGLVGLAAPTSMAHATPASPSVVVALLTHPSGTSSICVGPNATTFDGGCISQENSQQPAYLAWNGSSNDTFDFGFGELVEITSGNSVVAQSNLLYPLPENTTVTGTAQETNFTTTWEDFVTNSSGNWNPDYAQNVGWPQGTHVLGNVNVTIIFHVMHTGSDRWEIKFDFKEAGWPWISNADQLGIMIFAHAPVYSTPTFYPGNRTLMDLDNVTHAALAGYNFGGNASEGSSGTPLSVDVAVGTYYPPNPLGHATSEVLLNFTDAPGGYSSLAYDPWILFSPVPSTVGKAPPLPSSTQWFATATWLAVGIGVALMAIVFIAAWNGNLGRVFRDREELSSADPTVPE